MPIPWAVLKYGTEIVQLWSCASLQIHLSSKVHPLKAWLARRGEHCVLVCTHISWLKENATDGKCANCWRKGVVDKIGEINIPSAPGMGFNFPLWAFLLQLGKLIIYISAPGGKVEVLLRMSVSVLVCVKFGVHVWLGRPGRTHESTANRSEARTTFHRADTLVTQLNDSAVTG